MIRYQLKCAKGHSFTSWFADSAAYDALAARGALECAICGSRAVEKALMAPSVAGEAETLSAAPADPAAQALAALRDHVENTAEHVGKRFAEEARAIHRGEAEKRAIWGEATLGEARALAEDGAPVAPLPFMPRRND